MNFDYSYVDIAFINGRVITVNENDDIAEAVGIKGNKIVFVGTTKELETIIDEKTKVYDLKGRTLMPGMIDTHIHPFLLALLGTEPDAPMISLFGGRIASLADIKNEIDKALKIKNAGDWISMWGYEPPNLAEKRDPTIEELDAWAPENPVQCMEGSGHKCMFNSKALEKIGLYTAEDAKKFPEGDVQVKDGKLTGMLFGVTLFELWGKVDYPEEALETAVCRVGQEMISKGLTSIHDMGALDRPSYHSMQKLARERKFKPRVYMALHSIFGKPYSMEDNRHMLEELGLRPGLGDNFFRMGSNKFMIDGGSSGPSCYTREPYDHDPSMLREKAWTEDEVADYICLIDKCEGQATAHAIGDGAVEYMVKGFEKAFAACDTEEKKAAFRARRHRIEHCTLTDQDLIDRMAVMNICPSVNAGIPAKNGGNYERFYGKRNAYFGALKSMIDAGMKPSLQSDSPSGPYGFECLDGAVNRIDRVRNIQCNQTQCVSVLEGVRIATLYGAYGSYEDDIKGSLEIGKLADMIVCDCDILAIDKTDLYKVQVDLTMIDGKVEFVREGADI
ncbi:MAG: amidohydrolase [Eubacteriales bacterium]|nr:amidohydrolase [Eubacteriales bacterium]